MRAFTKLQKKHVVAAIGLVGAILFGLAPANAATIVWDFSPLTNTDIGTSANFTSGGIQITAAGFTSSTFGTATHLFSKDRGGNEHGLGLTNDPSGQNEITGTNVIWIDFSGARSAGVTGFSFQMDSTSGGEGWLVFGSNSIGSGYTQVANGTDERLYNLSGTAATYSYYYFVFDPTTLSTGNTNVLLHEVDGIARAVPLPAALPLFATGLGALGLLGWRRKRKAAALAA